MSDRMDTALREAFDYIAASEPVPDGLAKAALVRARRQRFGRAALVGGAAMACAAAVAVTAVVVPATPSDEVAGGTERRTIVAFGGFVDRGDPATPDAQKDLTHPLRYSLVLDPKTGKYERMPYWRVRPSPDGRRALVWEQGPFKVGVWERRTGTVRWFKAGSDLGDTGEWSRDGKRILFTSTPETGHPVMMLADPDTMTLTRVNLPDRKPGSECVFMQLVFTPDSEGVAESAHCKAGGQWGVSGIRTYDLTGKRKGAIPATEPMAGPIAYSPDGTMILLAADRHRAAIVIDAATGAERPKLPLTIAAGTPGSVGIIGWYDDQHLAVYSINDPYSDNAKASLLVVDLAGTTVETLPVPAYLTNEVVLGTVRG
jgi:hypothetical protein